MKLALAVLVLAACGDDPVRHLPDGPQSLATPGIYVTTGAGAIVVFPLDATGDTAPIRTISGPSTNLSLPIGIAVDHQGLVYVANRTGSTVTLYPKDGDGDLAPVRTLTAPTMLSPETIALDPDDNVFVATCPNCGQAAGGDIGVFHFAPGVAPDETSDGELTGAATLMTNPGIALDDQRQLVIANSFGGVVETFAANATGNTAPLRSFTPAGGQNIQSLTVAGGAYVIATPADGLDLFDAQTTGDSAAPAATIGASALGLSYPGGIFLDGTVSPPVLYVSDFSGGSVIVAETTGSGANLAISKIRTTITGPTTMLTSPLDIVVIH